VSQQMWLHNFDGPTRMHMRLEDISGCAEGIQILQM